MKVSSRMTKGVEKEYIIITTVLTLKVSGKREIGMEKEYIIL